ncbi:DeoR/GlpR transcriptional regulator [Natronospirillum operosum]|uniref:DeoR/GlpR transcriptional regulator n=1 Tax=Natronospirillum operosum TaxID=2759953 RepID=A0A4Z0W1F7_9GAMM|nr:DeoR/GlpR family DNA-binding transcription regulator [Natronospirillum operosum]TGG90253.1 DeoR/GlpR transcriptional regulator [Natronospirillum operosum]
MKLSTRQQTILDWARQDEHLEVDTLAERFEVSPQTIRKDINQLCESGLLRRRYGGVSLPSSVSNLSFSSRQVLNQLAKQAIASRLAAQIPDQSSVYLGIGTTIEFVARELSEHEGLKVFTNNLNVASLLCNSAGVDVQVAGGRLRHNDHDVVGERTTRFFGEFCADFGIIGTGSLDPAYGLMDFEIEEARVSQAILGNARRRILVADQSKWDRQALARVAPFDAIDLLITDTMPPSPRAALPPSVVVLETEPEA